MINKNGKIVIPFAIQYISKCENGLFLTLANRTISIRDSTNKVIVPYGLYTRHATPAQPKVWMEGNDEPHNNWRPPYFYVSVKFQKYLGVLKGGKWAVINNFGREIIQPKFDWIGTFTGNIAPIRIGTKYGVTNALGNNIVPPEYDDARILNQQFTQVELNKKCGVVSSDNKVVIALIYHDVTLINSNNFLVDTNGTYGVIDKNNNVIIPLKYSHIEGFGNGYLVTNKNDGTALFNALGKRLTNLVPGYSFQTGPVWTMREGGYVVYRQNTRDFNHYGELKDNLFYYRNKKWGVLGTTGAEITPPVYNIIDGPFAHIYIAHKEGKISLVNENGKFIPNHIYDEAKYISGGKFKVRRGDKWGLIDFTGKVLYPCIYWDSQIWYDELQDKFIVIK